MPVRACLALTLGVLALTSCTRELPPFQSAPLTGDPAVLSKFEGRWYRFQSVMAVQVSMSPSPHLSLRLPHPYTISDARSSGDEIHFSLIGGDVEETHLSIRLLADDVLVVLPPGSEPSWCGTCTPRYERPRAHQLLGWKARGLVERAYETCDKAYHDVWSWLIEVL